MKIMGGPFTPRPRCPSFVVNHFWQVKGGAIMTAVILGLN